MILQPKRWQRAEDPKYDPIRHKPWFARLLKRKQIIPLMEGCFDEWHYSEEKGLTHDVVCDRWSVSPREFRDYCKLRGGLPMVITPVFLSVLTSAYNDYCESNAMQPIQRFIDSVAPLYGVNSRHVFEQWEIDPSFYPSDYAYPRN